MSSDLFESDEVSMVDVLAEDKELEAEANAVFGDIDDQTCTYDKGYMKRQALYACLTCTPAAPETNSAGVCLACSLSCHDGHELVELYTKRSFRCDCGNEMFPNFQCTLQQSKDAVNTLNKYNQNFKGLYCTCHRPYPDPDDEIEDEMIQCVSCEDWFHSRHLGNLPPFGGDFSEMICDHCMEKCSFLQAYLQYSAASQQICSLKKSETDEKVDIERDKTESVNGGHNSSLSSGVKSDDKEREKALKRKLNEQTKGQENKNYGETTCKKLCKDENTKSTENTENNDNQNDGCIYKKLLKNVEEKSGCTYWKDGWRSQLCLCKTCKALYKEQDVEFLIDASDTITAYEERGQSHRAQQSSSYDSSLNALNSLGRVQQIEILHGYNDMKTQLTNYLAEFAKEGKTVTKEDIQTFFHKLREKKNNESGNIPHYCR